MSETIEQERGVPPLGYWEESARPLVSLIFVIPLLAIYEIGVVLLGPQALRNGVDVWLRTFLEAIGFGQYLLLPVLTICFLLGWHHMKRQRWTVTPRVLPLMLLESAILGLLLLGFAHWLAAVMDLEVAAGTEPALPSEIVRQMIAYAGAGIYEELLFRLILIPVLWQVLAMFGVQKVPAAIGAVLLSSLIFSAVHYDFVTAAGDSFEWYSFTFRFLAGVVFACLFAFRGFGIAAVTHALFNMFTLIE